MEARLSSGDSPEALAPVLAARGAREVTDADGGAEAVDDYELATPSHMAVTGIARWLSKRVTSGS